MTTNGFLQGVSSSNARRAFEQMKILGRAGEISEFQLQHYRAGTKGKQAVVVFRCNFEGGKSLVKVETHEEGGVTKVHYMNIHVIESGTELIQQQGFEKAFLKKKSQIVSI